MSSFGIDRRRDVRFETQVRGWICVAGRPRLPCTVTNLSLQGALLAFDIPAWLPSAFKLVIESMKYETYCEVRHAGDGTIGVRFAASLPAAQQEASAMRPQPSQAAAIPRPMAPPAPAAQGIERRQFGRRQTYLHAWISVPGRARLPCIVRDISVGGALLELERPPWLPYNFELTIESTRFKSMCEVRHQGAAGIGVRFIASAAAAPPDARRATEKRSADDKQSWTGR